MPITAICDGCSTTHRLRDTARGKRFKCKGCGKDLTAEDSLDSANGPSEFEAHSDVDDEPASSPRSRKRATSKTSQSRGKVFPVPMSETHVLSGINCVYFGFMILSLLMVVIVVSSLLGPVRVARMMPLLSVVGFLASILTAAGKMMCLSAPSQMQGKKFIYVAVAIDLLALLLPILGLFVPLPRVLVGATNLFSFAGLICFVLFLKSLGQFIEESDVSDRAENVLTFGGAFIGLWLVMIALLIASPKGAVFLVLIFGFALVVVGALLGIRYAGLLNSCRYAVLSAR